jgi:N-acetylneuraminate synthase/N,N'-diacetyllegionaminate synthase
MIISTGMANLSEVFAAVQAIRSVDNNDIIVLQCNTNYPSKIEDTNIKAMLTMRDAIGVRIGYSDHVPNNYACYAAVALGAEVIEKHFTLDKNMEGPDHSCSLEPTEFKELIEGVRNVEKCLGTGIKTPSQSEINNTYGMRRSLVARTDLQSGTVLEEKHFGFKRPANGLSPNYLETLIGKKLKKDIAQDEAFTFDSIEF